MKRVSTAFALTALAAATVVLAQAPPQTPAEPPASTPHEQYPHSTTPPSDPSAGASTGSSSTDKQALMKKCIAQVKASNPGVPENDVKQFCAKEVYRSAPQD